MSDRPTAEEIGGWIGHRVDELSGAGVGKVEGAYADAESGRPEWLVVRVGRLGDHCCVPAREAVAAAGHVWVPWDRTTIRDAPRVDVGAPLTAGDELRLCSHYGIPEGQGRAAELTGAAPAATTGTRLG